MLTYYILGLLSFIALYILLLALWEYMDYRRGRKMTEISQPQKREADGLERPTLPFDTFKFIGCIPLGNGEYLVHFKVTEGGETKFIEVRARRHDGKWVFGETKFLDF